MSERRPGPGIAISLIVIVIGIALAAVGAAISIHRIVSPFTASLTAPTEQTPVSMHEKLKADSYAVYQYVGSPGDERTTTLGPSDVTVTHANGNPLSIHSLGLFTDTLTRNGAVYQGVARFNVPSAGTYDVSVRSPAAGTQSIVIAPTLGSGLHGILTWLIMIALGALVLIAGVVMLIVGLVRRH